MAGLTQEQVANQLGWSPRTVKTAESIPLECWSVGELARYAAACGYVIKMVAVDQDGEESELT